MLLFRASLGRFFRGLAAVRLLLIQFCDQFTFTCQQKKLPKEGRNRPDYIQCNRNSIFNG